MKRKVLILTLILSVILFAGRAWPDFGSFSGNSDYSSSRSSSRSSSSSNSSSRNTSIPSRSYSSGNTSTPRRSTGNINVLPMAGTTFGITSGGNDDVDITDDDFNECTGVAFILIVFLIFWFIIHRKSKKRQQEHAELTINEPVRVLRPMDEYLELDPEFDEERIKTLISNLYVQMQQTWQAKDISSLRPYMTDKFFAQMDNQLDQFRKMGRTDYTERIAVLSTDLRGWRQSAGMDYITVGLNSRIVSYTLDDRTGELISGDKKREKFMEYELELCRKSGETTHPESEGTHSETCPHCGAPLKLNASAQCEYCGSVITQINTDWAICGMRGISQRTM